MCNKGSNTTTTQTQPNAQAMTAYQDLLSRAGGVANTPYQPYTGQLVAPVNAQQNLGIAGTNTFANAAQPAYGAALTQAASSSAPLNAAAINQYMSPYIQGVVNSTQNQFNNQNQQQQQQVLGNAIAQGALGGNRSAVAQAELANQQQLAQAPVIANLYNQGYGQAVNTAMGEQGIGLQGAGLQGNLGAGAQSAGLQGAAAQMGAGTLQQQTQQAQDTANYGQYAQQQAYPFQTAQWLAGIDTGVGSQMGGTSQTTLPYPNPWATGLGLGTAGVGLLGQSGAFGSSGWLASALPGLLAAAKGGAINLQDVAKYAHGGGVVPHFDAGGVAPMPWAGAPSWVPNASIVHGRGAPNPPQGYDPNKQMQQDAKMIGDLSKTLTGNNNSGPTFSGPAYGGGNILTDAYGGSSSNPLPGLDKSDYGPMSRGGVAGVKGYDDGGTVSDADRAAGLQLLADQMGAAGYPPTPAGPPSDSDRAAGVQMLKDQMVINPNEPYRMPDKPSVDNWRGDVNNPAIVADSSPDGGVAPTRAMSFSNDKSDSTPLPPEAALGYSSDSSPQVAGIVPPSATPSSSSPGINWGADSKLWPSLVSAGFGMMASRSPFLGVAIGEGGQAGIGSYNEQQRQDFEAQKYAQDLALRAAAEKRAEEQARFSQANQQVIFDKNGNPVPNQALIQAQEAAIRDKWGLGGYLTTPEGQMHPIILNASTGDTLDAVTHKPPNPGDTVVGKGGATLSPQDADRIAEYTLRTGDDSRMKRLGLNGANNALLQNAITRKQAEMGMTDADYARKRQEYASNQTRLNAGARTQATREENLNMIIRAADAAIPAALEESEKVKRYTGIVPLDSIIQHGQIITNDPNLVTFGMANLQLAEHWARAMNPMGVMRESDRDLALKYLNTAFSQNTYRQAVLQLQKQIQRERDSIVAGNTTIPENGYAKPGELSPAHKSELPKGEGAQTTTKKPSLEEFLAAAKKANPNATEQQLTEYYNKKYGRQ